MLNFVDLFIERHYEIDSENFLNISIGLEMIFRRNI